MALRDRHDFDSLVNEAEDLVVAELEAQLARPPAGATVCVCRECVLDMAADALNRVRPSYRVSLMGTFSVSTAARATYAREISKAVREAIDKIRANPSHD
jgi:competence protein ComFB